MDVNEQCDYDDCFKGHNDELDDEFQTFLLNASQNLKKLTMKSDNEDSDCELEDDFIKYINSIKSTPAAKSKPPEHKSPSITHLVLEEKSSSESGLDIHFSAHSNTDLKDKPYVDDSNYNRKCKSTSEEEFSFLFNGELESEKNFYKNRDKYTEYWFKYFNKKVFDDQLPKDTPLTWNDYLRTTAGKTRCRRKENVHTCEILLSTKVLTSFDRLRDTLLHEMCHAAVWIINKEHRVSHGPLWQIWAARCKLILPEIDLPQRCHNYEIAYPFLYKCEHCSWKCGRYQKSKKLNNAQCPYCKHKIVLIRT